MTTSTMDSEKSGVASPRLAPTSGAEHSRLDAASTREGRLVLPLAASGTAILRYGLAFLLLLWGGFKFFDFEAQAIVPLVENSPWLSWLYDVFGVRGAAALFGVAEVGAGLAIAARRFFPRVSGYGSLVAALVFLTTSSFLLTTPGVLALDNPWGSFLMKDIVLLGAALVTAAEAFGGRWHLAPER